MQRHHIIAALGCAAALGLEAGAIPALAADEASKDIIAAQIRRQGFSCPKALKAERGVNKGDPDDGVWVLTCDVATYKVRLIPNMAASVERIADDGKGTQTP